jgi:hypothetical protein
MRRSIRSRGHPMASSNLSRQGNGRPNGSARQSSVDIELPIPPEPRSGFVSHVEVHPPEPRLFISFDPTDVSDHDVAKFLRGLSEVYGDELEVGASEIHRSKK